MFAGEGNRIIKGSALSDSENVIILACYSSLPYKQMERKETHNQQPTQILNIQFPDQD